MATAKILVAGATGNVGRTLVATLVSSGHAVRVMARDPRQAIRLLGPRVEVIHGDLGDRASLPPAFRGVASAFLATAPTPTLDEQEINFIEAARAAKIARLVKLSGFGTEFSTDRIHVAHRPSEETLRGSGVPSVVLRPVIYMSNLLFDAASIRTGKLPSLFRDGRINLVDPRDVGEVAARVLLEPGNQGQILEFGGADALSYYDVAATFTRVLGRRVEHVHVNESTFEAEALRNGLPGFVVEAITAAASAARNAKYEVNDDVVQRVLGRRASSPANWIARHRDAFGPEGVR